MSVMHLLGLIIERRCGVVWTVSSLLTLGYDCFRCPECATYSSKSDHLPLVVEIRNFNSGSPRRGRRLKFEKMWLQREGCENVIRHAWASPSLIRCPVVSSL